MSGNMSKWIRGTVFAALGLTGLYLASLSTTDWGVGAGIAVLVLAFILIMRCIRRNVGVHKTGEGQAH